jgi:hypothetical protein
MIIIADSNNKVLASFLDGTQHEQLTIQDLPKKNVEIAGKDQILLFDPVTKNVYYEYQDRALTSDEKIELTRLDQLTIVKALTDRGLISKAEKIKLSNDTQQMLISMAEMPLEIL